MYQRGDRSTLAIARSELRTERRERFLYTLLLSFSLVMTFLFLLFMTIDVFEPTGRSNAVNASAGSITTLLIEQNLPVDRWVGVYGLALRVDGFSQQLSEEIDAGTIERVDLFFDCMDLEASGGPALGVRP